MKYLIAFGIICLFYTTVYADISITEHCNMQDELVTHRDGTHGLAKEEVCTSTPEDWKEIR